MPHTKQELEERYQKLPDALKDALFSAEVASKIFALGKKFLLTIEKIGWLAEETGYVILGLTRPQEFSNILAKRLELTEEEGQKIASEINRQIFWPIRESLKAAHKIEIIEEEEEPVAPKKPDAIAMPYREAVPPKIETPAPKLEPIVAPLPKPAEEKPSQVVKPPEKKIISPPPQGFPKPLPKITPIDLRPEKRKTEVPMQQPEGRAVVTEPVKRPTTPPPEPPPSPPEKKPPSRVYDPYRESVE